MFENLTNKLENLLSKLKAAPSLTKEQVSEGMVEIRQALLEADVSLSVVKELVSSIQKKAVGQEIIRSTSPGQMIVKIVSDELIKILGEKNEDLNLNSTPPISYLLVGLQGSGKTTTAAKLAKFIEKKNNKKVMLVSLDVYRPAAQEQLKILADQNKLLNLPVVEKQLPLDIASRALNAASLNGADVVIFDSAGRTQIDLNMMNEIKKIKEVVKPLETILVADSLTGQVAVDVANEFNSAIQLSSIVLTRVDGDGKGGAALSMKYVTGKPIKFIGVGEKIDDLELFHPKRIANRILGMGDIVSLVEKAAQDLDDEKIKKTEAIKENIEHTDDELISFASMLYNFPKEQFEDFKLFINKENEIDIDILLEQLSAELMWKKLLQKKFSSKIIINKQEILIKSNIKKKTEWTVFLATVTIIAETIAMNENK